MCAAECIDHGLEDRVALNSWVLRGITVPGGHGWRRDSVRVVRLCISVRALSAQPESRVYMHHSEDAANAQTGCRVTCVYPSIGEAQLPCAFSISCEGLRDWRSIAQLWRP